jgi:hypothetical protein
LKIRDEIEGQKIEVRLRNELDSIQHVPGGTHPGTEGGAVGRGLMVRVVRLVLDRLRIADAIQE